MNIAYKIGGYYDILLGIALLFQELSASIFNVQEVNPPIIARALGLFLLAMGFFLIYTSNQAHKYLFVGLGSASIRIVFAIMIFIDWSNVAYLYQIIGFTDALTAMLILFPVYRLRTVITSN